MTTMTHARRWRGGGRVARSLRAAAVVTLLTATISSPAVGATPTHKTYTVGVTPSIVNGGTTQQFTVEISNTSDNHQLGSVNLTAPTGFELTDTSQPPQGTAEIDSSDDVLKLRNLALDSDESVAVGFEAEVPCGPGSYTWDPAGKQSNEFNGTGNDFILDEGGNQLGTTVINCQEPYDLRFKTQPTSTVVNEPINNPNGVEVEIVDSAGEPVLLDGVEVALSVTDGSGSKSGELVGDTTSSTVGGVATFNPVSIDHVGVQYTATAISSVGDATSNLFDVVGDKIECAPGKFVKTTKDGVVLSASCPATDEANETDEIDESDSSSAADEGSGGDNAGSGLLSVTILSADDMGTDVEAAPDCGDPDNHTHPFLFVVSLWGADGSLTANGPTATIDFSAADDEDAPSDICFKYPQTETVDHGVEPLPERKVFLQDPTNPDTEPDFTTGPASEGHLRKCTAPGTPDGVDAPCVAEQLTTNGKVTGHRLRLAPGDPYCA